MSGETIFTLDMRGMPKDFSFAHMIKLYDAFVRVWKHTPRTLIMTPEQVDVLYPERKFLKPRVYRWRGIPIKEMSD